MFFSLLRNLYLGSRVLGITVSVITLVACLPAAGIAQKSNKSDQPDVTLNADLRKEVIDGALKALNQGYVFPEVAKKMEAAVRSRMEKKEYDAITSGGDLARTLTSHLQEVSGDKHLRVTYSRESIPVHQKREPSPQERERFRTMMRARNFGFEKVERLSGNIGYLDLRGFMHPEEAGETAAAAMAFLTNTDALILDLRKNGGGHPAMVALLCSYFFGAESVHLNDLYWREGDRTQQFWTLPYVPGKRYVDKDVYVLTSKRTFSGAEECTYNLKNLKRATIVGETTGGGDHPGGTRRINDHFAVWVPSGRAISPITKTNWEGTGVKPDVEVPADLALKTAHLSALKKLAEKDPKGQLVSERKTAIRTVEREIEEQKKKVN